jgi:hypothetical protein
MDYRHFAKMLVTQGIDSGQTREDFENDIAKRAEAIRRPGESREQVWTRFATETDDGRLLFKAAMRRHRHRSKRRRTLQIDALKRRVRHRKNSTILPPRWPATRGFRFSAHITV